MKSPKSHEKRKQKHKQKRGCSKSRTSSKKPSEDDGMMFILSSPVVATSTSSSASTSTGDKSKLLLLLIELVYPLGWFGLDRLYMGCPGTALLKLMLFVVGVVLFNYKFYNAGVTLLLIWLFVGLVDFILVIINAITQSKTNPFCTDSSRRYASSSTGVWSSQSEIQYGAWFAMGIVLIYLFTTALAQTQYDIFGRVRATLAPDNQ